jgi:excisionase family DNA binding protein
MQTPRFYTPADAAEILATSVVQIMALIKRGDLLAIQIGGRNQWRIEVSELEAYIQRQYDAARARRDSEQPAHDDQAADRH